VSQPVVAVGPGLDASRGNNQLWVAALSRWRQPPPDRKRGGGAFRRGARPAALVCRGVEARESRREPRRPSEHSFFEPGGVLCRRSPSLGAPATLGRGALPRRGARQCAFARWARTGRRRRRPSGVRLASDGDSKQRRRAEISAVRLASASGCRAAQGAPGHRIVGQAAGSGAAGAEPRGIPDGCTRCALPSRATLFTSRS
jgi:hypothetical protein